MEPPAWQVLHRCENGRFHSFHLVRDLSAEYVVLPEHVRGDAFNDFPGLGDQVGHLFVFEDVAILEALESTDVV